MSDGSNRVLRGSYWDFVPQSARVADRFCGSPGTRFGDLGFRLVEEVEDSVPAPAASGSARVNRGGGWYAAAHYAMVAYRIRRPHGYIEDGVGIRLVEEIDE